MTSAFPQEQPFNAFSAGAAAIPVPDRGTHIPAFYVRNPHADPNLVVKRGGIPLLGADGKQITVGQVAPERRWAIQADGNIMEGEQFKAAIQHNILEFYEMLKERGNPHARYMGKIDNEPIPDPAYYVSWGIDPRDPRRLLQIGFDPDKTRGAKPQHFFDSKGEEIIASRIDVLVAAYHDPRGRQQLTASEIREVEMHLGVKESAGADGIAAKLETLAELHRAGDLADAAYLAAVGRLTGAGVEVERQQPDPVEPIAVESNGGKPAKPIMLTRCGKEVRGNQGLGVHQRNCKKCKALDPGGQTEH